MKKYKVVTESFKRTYFFIKALIVIIAILYNSLMFFFSSFWRIFLLVDFGLLWCFGSLCILFSSIISYVIYIEKDRIVIKIFNLEKIILFNDIKKVNITTDRWEGTKVVSIIMGKKVKINFMLSSLGRIIGKFKIVNVNYKSKILIKVADAQDFYEDLQERIGVNNV